MSTSNLGHALVAERLDAQGTPATGARTLPDDPTSLLLARLADGDRGVSSELFRALWPPVRRLAGSLLLHDADAEDAAQDAMVTIFSRIADYDRSRPGLPWALAIAGFACRTVKKRRLRRREEPEAAAADVAGSAAPDDDALQRDLLAAALTTLDALSDVDRETLVATYWEERASASGASGATFRKRRERALDRLKALFRRVYGLG